jgi:low affinity Fe/Cu permease
MIFIIESTVEADNRAMQEKLDEIIKKLPQANNSMIGIEKEYKGEEETDK